MLCTRGAWLRLLQCRFPCSCLDCCQGHIQNLHCDGLCGFLPCSVCKICPPSKLQQDKVTRAGS